MLRDPLAFVWRYALGWRSPVEDEGPLSLDTRAFGELVHEMPKRAVDTLEPNPGYLGAARHDIEAAMPPFRNVPVVRAVGGAGLIGAAILAFEVALSPVPMRAESVAL